MRLRMLISYAIAAFVVYGCGRVSLETRTFQLRYMDAEKALALVDPYIYGDRQGAPGVSSAVDRAITVRETADNLDRIGRVLEEYDLPRPGITLHFQLIGANGNGGVDSSIAEIESELRKLFRFDGYQLLTETVVTTLAGRGFSQPLFAESPRAERFPTSFDLAGVVGLLQGTRDSARVELEVNLQGLLGASVAVPVGHTVVLGTTRLPGRRAIILTVRAELTDGP